MPSELQRLTDEVNNIYSKFADIYEHISNLHSRDIKLINNITEMKRDLIEVSEIVEKAKEIVESSVIEHIENGEVRIKPRD